MIDLEKEKEDARQQASQLKADLDEILAKIAERESLSGELKRAGSEIIEKTRTNQRFQKAFIYSFLEYYKTRPKVHAGAAIRTMIKTLEQHEEVDESEGDPGSEGGNDS